MPIPLQVFIAAIALAFLFYGYNCLFSTKLVLEFNRFGLSSIQRNITGSAQILGSLGLVAGLVFYPLGFVASLGLSVLMLFGFGVRLKIKDTFTEAAPSFILLLVNGYFCYRFWLLL
jgi:DoxX-like family